MKYKRYCVLISKYRKISSYEIGIFRFSLTLKLSLVISVWFPLSGYQVVKCSVFIQTILFTSIASSRAHMNQIYFTKSTPQLKYCVSKAKGLNKQITFRACSELFSAFVPMCTEVQVVIRNIFFHIL